MNLSDLAVSSLPKDIRKCPEHGAGPMSIDLRIDSMEPEQHMNDFGAVEVWSRTRTQTTVFYACGCDLRMTNPWRSKQVHPR